MVTHHNHDCYQVLFNDKTCMYTADTTYKVLWLLFLISIMMLLVYSILSHQSTIHSQASYMCISQSIQLTQFTSSTKLIHMQTLAVSYSLLTKTNTAAARVNLDWTTSHKKESLQTTGAGFFIHQIPFLSPNQQCQNTQENQRGGSFNTTSYKLS